MLVEKFNYTPLDRQSVDGKRHYCLPDGNSLVSVTTILDRTKPQETKLALENWKKTVGEKQAQLITTEAASRGTRMHKWLEDYVLNNRNMGSPGTMPASKQSYKMAEEIVSKGLVHVSEMWGIEVPLYVSGLYAGTTDACGVYKGNPSIIDYKQTNKPKKTEWVGDYFLQLVAYGLAHNETYGTTINQGVILMCSKDFEFQDWVITGDEWDYWTEEWLKRVEQYYNLS